MDVRLEGLEPLKRALHKDTLREPLRDLWEKVGIRTQSAVRPEVPVSEGQLRNAIAYEVINEGDLPLGVKVGVLNASEGTPLWYKARAMEWGTGSAGDPGVSHKASHFPPPEALEVWALRHGIEGGGFVVARAIARRGGLEPRHYLQRGWEMVKNSLQTYFRQAVSDIKRQFDSTR